MYRQGAYGALFICVKVADVEVVLAVFKVVESIWACDALPITAGRVYNQKSFSFRFRAMLLSDLPSGQAATIERVEDRAVTDAIATRLRDLGFVAGEPVKVVARGLIGADPLVVQIGFTRFALRRAEAARVIVQIAA